VLRAADALLGQCGEIVRVIDDEVYVLPSRVLRGGTIGKHLRHTLDHYAAIVADAVGGNPIDYDHRVRGVPVETDRGAAGDEIRSVRTALAGLRGAAHEPVRIRVMLAAEGAEALLDSTLAREIAFATHHGIHHVAMMKAIAAEAGVLLGDEVGKAPSTLQFERSSA
jgi:hypothetical protein